MSSFVVLTDSTSDLPAEIRQQYGINYFPMEFSSGDKEYIASLDWSQIGSHDFYESMRNGTRYKTAQVSMNTLLLFLMTEYRKTHQCRMKPGLMMTWT